MKKVKIKVWIPVQYPSGTNSGNQGQPGHQKISGTGCWSEDFTEDGVFHCWGSAYEEFDLGPANYTIAIVQLNDGTISEVLPSNIKFIKN